MYGNTPTLTAVLALCLFVSAAASTAKPPVITHVTDPAIPGKLSVIVGYGWDTHSPQLRAQAVTATSSVVGEPGSVYEWQAGKGQDLKVARNNGQTLACEFPSGKFTVMAVSAKSPKGWGEPIIVNRATIDWLSMAAASSMSPQEITLSQKRSPSPNTPS